MRGDEYDGAADDTSIEQLEGDKRVLRSALRDIVRRAGKAEDRPEVFVEIAERALAATP